MGGWSERRLRRLNTGRRTKCLKVANDFSCECVSIALDCGGISAHYVNRQDQATIFQGNPQAVRIDNGPFTSRAFTTRASAHGIRCHILIELGRTV